MTKAVDLTEVQNFIDDIVNETIKQMTGRPELQRSFAVTRAIEVVLVDFVNQVAKAWVAENEGLLRDKIKATLETELDGAIKTRVYRVFEEATDRMTRDFKRALTESFYNPKDSE